MTPRRSPASEVHSYNALFRLPGDAHESVVSENVKGSAAGSAAQDVGSVSSGAPLSLPVVGHVFFI